jgi:hypothetical protein
MRKRVLLLTVLLVALAMASAGLAAPAGAGPNDPTVLFGARPEPGTMLGTTALEAKLGRRLAAMRVYYNWDSPFPDRDLGWFNDNGYTLLLSVKSERRNHSFVQWRDIADAQPGSTLHNDIVRWADRVRSLGNHVYFTFNHEPETSLNASGGAPDWYPGEGWLDYVGADAYNWHTCRPGTSNPWTSLEQLLNPLRLFVQGKAIKGIMVPEWASTEDPARPGRKAQWIADAHALFKKPGWEGFKGVLYYNKTSKYPNCRWFVDSSQASLAAFSAMANDVYYTLDETGSGPVP